MEDKPKIDLIAAAIAKAQATLSNVSKDKANPFFKSKYADLGSVIDAVRGPRARGRRGARGGAPVPALHRLRRVPHGAARPRRAARVCGL